MNSSEDLCLDLLKKCLTAYIYDKSSNRPLAVAHDRHFEPKELFKRDLMAMVARCGLEVQRIFPLTRRNVHQVEISQVLAVQ